MTRRQEPPPPPPLPIRVRPTTGESVDSYIRRLAHANHLRPSLLHAYLRWPSTHRSVRLDRLAAASGRSIAALTNALTPRPPRAPLGRRPEPSRKTPQAERKAALFAMIRADAASGMAPSAIATRHGTGYRIVRQALASPTPPPRKPRTQDSPILDPIRATIDALLRDEPTLTIAEIWARIIDDYNTDVSYSTVRIHIRQADWEARANRLAPPAP